jgi:hypothetical protein
MTQTSVTPKIHKPLDIGRNIPAQITFDLHLTVDNIANLADLDLCEIVGPGIKIDRSLT